MSEIFLLFAVFFLPFGTRLEFLNEWSMYGGVFNEYLTYFVYFTDVLLVLVLVFWLVDMMVKFAKFGDWDDWKINPWNALVIVLLFVLVFWGFYSIIWSQLSEISIYKSFRFLGIFGLISYLVLAVKNNYKLWKWILIVFISAVVLQSVWGILQYYVQHDFGFWWLGESVLGTAVDGVAKVDVGLDKYIRAYGALPHANIFGFLMWTGMVSTFIIYHLAFIKFSEQKLINNIVFGLLFGLIGLGVLVSFSRLIWLVTGVILIGYLVQVYLNRLNNIKIDKEKSNNNSWVVVLIFCIVMVFGVVANKDAVFVRSNPDISNDISIETREIYDSASNEMISDAYYSGWGMGNFVYVMPYFSSNLQSWMYQPVHNLYKLVWSELGVFGFLALSLSMIALLATIVFGNKKLRWFLLSVWIGMIVLQMFDHYMWDVWQGMLLFGLLVGMLLVFRGKLERSVDK